MRVTVKQIDINRGEAGDSDNCPVSRAIRRALGYRKYVWVGIDDYGVGFEGNQVAVLPTKVADFIYFFDSLGPQHVEPFTFVTRRPA